VRPLTRRDVETFVEHRPPPGLAGYLTCTWQQQVGRTPYAQRTVPNGSVELVWSSGSPVSLVGPQSGPTVSVVAPGTVRVGVRLRPAVAPALLGLPAAELRDLEVGVGTLGGRSTEALDDELARASTPATALAALQRWLLARRADARPLDPVAMEAVRRLSPGPRSGAANEVATIARALSVSERQLRRRVEAAVGLAPKPLQRALRFQRFLALAAATERPSTQLAALAAASGYADQSHLNREAVRLAGRTPRALLLEVEHHCDGAHDHAASYAPLLRSR
jgi:AraC-like DNA-binding protein